MSQRLHVCQICGKKFATIKGVHGHQRMHSGLQRVSGLKDSRVCSLDQLRIRSSLGTENENHEVLEAAMNLVMLSQRVCRSFLPGDDDDDDSMELHGNELKTHSGFKKSRTCSDDVAREVPCAWRSELQRKTQSIYKCNICEKSFGCSQALGSHKRLRRSIKACKSEDAEDENSLFESSDANKNVSQSSSDEVSQDTVIRRLFHNHQALKSIRMRRSSIVLSRK